MCIALPEEGGEYLEPPHRRAPLAARRPRRCLAARAPRGPGLQPSPGRRRAGRPDRRAGHPRPRRARLRRGDGAQLPAARAAPPRGRDRRRRARRRTTSAAPPSAASAPPWSSASPTPSGSAADLGLARFLRSPCATYCRLSTMQYLTMPGGRIVRDGSSRDFEVSPGLDTDAVLVSRCAQEDDRGSIARTASRVATGSEDGGVWHVDSMARRWAKRRAIARGSVRRNRERASDVAGHRLRRTAAIGAKCNSLRS